MLPVNKVIDDTIKEMDRMRAAGGDDLRVILKWEEEKSRLRYHIMDKVGETEDRKPRNHRHRADKTDEGLAANMMKPRPGELTLETEFRAGLVVLKEPGVKVRDWAWKPPTQSKYMAGGNALIEQYMDPPNIPLRLMPVPRPLSVSSHQFLGHNSSSDFQEVEVQDDGNMEEEEDEEVTGHEGEELDEDGGGQGDGEIEPAASEEQDSPSHDSVHGDDGGQISGDEDHVDDDGTGSYFGDDRDTAGGAPLESMDCDAEAAKAAEAARAVRYLMDKAKSDRQEQCCQEDTDYSDEENDTRAAHKNRQKRVKHSARQKKKINRGPGSISDPPSDASVVTGASDHSLAIDEREEKQDEEEEEKGEEEEEEKGEEKGEEKEAEKVVQKTVNPGGKVDTKKQQLKQEPMSAAIDGPDDELMPDADSQDPELIPSSQQTLHRTSSVLKPRRPSFSAPADATTQLDPTLLRNKSGK
jgi:hypothetical protein